MKQDFTLQASCLRVPSFMLNRPGEMERCRREIAASIAQGIYKQLSKDLYLFTDPLDPEYTSIHANIEIRYLTKF